MASPRISSAVPAHPAPKGRKTFVARRRTGATQSHARLRALDQSPGLVLEQAELEALLALARAQEPVEAQRHAARLRAWLGPASPALDTHIETLIARAAELQHWKRLAATDPLTAVANRRVLNESLRRALSHASRSGKPLSLLLLDLDGLKQLNDESGHAAGDQALRLLARSAQQTTRGMDLVARIGGDEFAVMLPDTDLAGARATGERIRAELARAGEADGAALGVSFGVALARAGELGPHTLLARADVDLYRDKAQRRTLRRASRSSVAG